VRRLRQTGAIGGVLAICTFSAALCEDAPANRGLVEALDAIVRETCDYWTEAQSAAMHAMLVQSLGAPGLRALTDEERKLLPDAFRRRVEPMWRLREGSLEFQLARADLAWRFDCLFKRESPTEEQVAKLCQQAKELIAELSELPRSWAGGPLKWFMDDTAEQVQAEAEAAARDPLSPGPKRLLSADELSDLRQRLKARWEQELPLLEDRLKWIAGQERPNTRSLQAMASENGLRQFLGAISGELATRTRPAPSPEITQLSEAIAADRRLKEASRPKMRGDTPEQQVAQSLGDPYRPAVAQCESALSTIEAALLLRWCTGVDGLFIP